MWSVLLHDIQQVVTVPREYHILPVDDGSGDSFALRSNHT